MKAFTQGITKKEFLTEIYKHRDLDAFIKGDYSNNDKDHFQGCAVGCSLKSVADIKKIKLNYSNHKEYETHLGIPQWLARLEDRIFEGLPKERSKAWPVEFAEAVNEGADLSKAFIPMLIFICENAREKTKNELVHKYIDGVLAELNRPVINREALLKARVAKRPSSDYTTAAAADATAAAAYAATAYTTAAAADAAYAAAYTAYTAAYTDAAAADAYADAYAAAYAARSKAYVIFADKLLELIRGCQ